MQFVTTVTLDVPEDLGSFQEIELKARNVGLLTTQNLLLQVIEHFEKKLPDVKHFWIKDKRERNVQTIVGEFRISRSRVYDHKQKKYRYPLDEFLGLSERDSATPVLKQAIIETCVHRPYRQANAEILRWTGIKRQVMTDWKLVQRKAKDFLKKQPQPFDWYLAPLPQNTSVKDNPCPVLAIDLDGTYCQSQKKKHTDHDVKLSTIYTGKEAENKKKTRYKLVNKQVVSSRTTDSVRTFLNKVMDKATKYYGLNNDTFVIMHGDGDAWIKTFKTYYCNRVSYILDPWHVKKKIYLATQVSEIPKEWESCLYGDPDKLIRELEIFKLNKTTANSKQRKNMDDLILYLKNNKEGLMPSGIPKEIKQSHPRLCMRGSGQMESNIGKVICDRFKQNRMSWSGKGLDNLLLLRENHLNGNPISRYRVNKPIKRSKLYDGLFKH